MRDKFIRGIGIGLACSLALFSVAKAEEANKLLDRPEDGFPVYSASSDIFGVNNQIGFGLGLTSFNYLEKNGDLQIDSEEGHAPSIGVSLSLMKNLFINNFYLRFDYTHLSAQTDYIGGTFAHPWYGALKQTNNADVDDLNFRLGKGFQLQPNFMATPYLGVGYHSWQREICGAGGYKEDYTHGYVGGGLLLQWTLVPRLVLSANGLIGTTVGPRLSAYDTPFAMDVALGESVIFQTGVSLDYAVTQNVHINAGLEWVDFDYGKSVSIDFPRYGVYGVHEPNSRTQNTTVKLGVGYSFFDDVAPLK